MTGVTPSTSKPEYYSEDGIPWVTPTDINALTISDTPRKLSEEGMRVGRVVPANTILCTCIASIGKNALLTVKGSFNQQINSLTPNTKNDAYFLLTESELWSDKMKRMAASGTMQIVNKSEFAALTTMVPSIDEQKKLGTCFSNLDNLITLHQRKLDKLVNVKKSMLEKMFPQQGSRIPEIRFCGFTDDWEQREFSEMFDCTISNNTLSRSELSYEEGSILNIHYGDILIKYGSILDIHKYKIPRIPNKKKEDFKGSLLQPGDVVIADTAEDETSGKACEIGGLFGNSIVAGLHTMVARPNIEMASGYLGYYLNSNAYHCQLLPMMQGIKVQSLSRANVKKTALKFPESTKEQQLIANYFIQLDELITLHQRKLEKLKNIKKSMLEKMFI